MKHLLSVLGLILSLCFLSTAQSATVTTIIGANVDCSKAVCGLKLPLFELLCSGVNCPEKVAMDANVATFYGSNGTTLMRSTNKGSTWTALASLPARSIFGGNPMIGVASNGNVIVGYSTTPFPSCVIYVSTDGTASWTEAYFQPHACAGTATDNGVKALQCNGAICFMQYKDTANHPAMLYTSNSGATWTNDGSLFTLVTDLAPLKGISWNGTQAQAYFGFTGFGSEPQNIFYTPSGIGGWVVSPWIGSGTLSCFQPIYNSSLENIGTVCVDPSFRFANVEINGDFTAFTMPANVPAGGALAITSTALYNGVQYIFADITSGTCNFFANGGGASTVFTSLTCASSAVLDAFRSNASDMIVNGTQIYGTGGLSGASARLYRLNP